MSDHLNSMQGYRILSALLLYPEPELQQELPALNGLLLDTLPA